MKKQFNVRIDEDIASKITLLQMLQQVKTDMLVSPGDINRAIIIAGVETLLNKDGGLDAVKERINAYFDKEMENMKHE